MSSLPPTVSIPKGVDREEWERQYIENYWMGLGDTTLIKTGNPLQYVTDADKEDPITFLLDLMRKPQYFYFTCKYIFNKKLPPIQLAIMRELWIRSFPMLIGARGLGKSWILAMYCMLRALFEQGRKIVIVGAAFRQAKFVFDYCQEIWDNAPVLRDIVGPGKLNGPRRDVDRCSLRMGDSIITAIPLGDGTKIRGQRGSIVIGEEFASIPVEIFDRVVRGFASVASSPIDKLEAEARKEAIKSLGKWTAGHEQLEQEGSGVMGNQIIISGTAYYAFNHFYDYWKRYKAIIESRGDFDRLANAFGGPDRVDPKLNYRDYCVMRIPVKKVPAGFMDAKQVAQAKATVHIGTYMSEFGACFITDSNGFYKRSLIESCVVGKPAAPISLLSCGEVYFNAMLRGDPKKDYVFAVDPASEQDNLSITILEQWPDHRRIVHCWTTTRRRFKATLAAGLTTEHDYYGYAARKIRDLMKAFPCRGLAMDSQGGGVAIMEALQDPDKMLPGEVAILPIVDPENPQLTDGRPGNHIITVVQFAKADWVRDANHGMRKDFEDKALLFPAFDAAELALALEDDRESGRVKADQDGKMEKLYDTLEDAVLEIEDLKEELATIVHTQTGKSMRDHWDTPETKLAGGKRGRLRKDRYSSLLMANMIGRTLQRAPVKPEYVAVGGFAAQMAKGPKAGGDMWVGPDWYVRAANAAGKHYGAVGKRSS